MNNINFNASLPIETPCSLNNRLIVQVYKKEALRSKEQNGFSFVDQKTALKGLKLLIDARLNDGTMIYKGSVAYVREEVLHTQQWAQKALECDKISEPFLMLDLNNVEFVVPA